MSSERLTALLDEYAELEKRLADPGIHADQATARRVGRRYAELVPLHKAAGELAQARADLAAARELAAEDPSFAAEAESIAASLPALEERLAELLIPRDPHDAKDVIVEIKAGEGGEESALFAGDLLRMYTRYAERRGWLVEVIDSQDSDLGGVKDVSLAIKSKGVPEGATASGPGSSGRAGCTACSGSRSPSRRAGSTPAPPVCWCSRRPRRSTSRSTPTTCGSTSSARPARAVSR